MVKPKANFLIDVLNEVVNPEGGVYTVEVTKSSEMKKYYGDNFYCVGGYNPKYAHVEFEEKIPPPELKKIFDSLEQNNILCHYGFWLIPGEPKTILVDYSKRMKELPKIKKQIWSEYHIDSRNCSEKLDRQIVWSDCLCQLFDFLLDLPQFKNKKGVVHFHLSDLGLLLLYLKKKNANVGLVYTAHSTRLGRYIAMNGEDLMTEIKKGLKKGKTVQKKREYRYGGTRVTVHQFERACAKAADVFTSVSETTAREAQYILGRKTDVVTPNGLDMENRPSLEDRATLHQIHKQKIYRFLNAYFLPYYPIDLHDSLLFFISGRYELNTKGYEILLDALRKLNDKLKKEEYDNYIFAFLFIMKKEGRVINKEILQNVAIYDIIEHNIEQELPIIEKKIINSLVHGQEIRKEVVFDERFLLESKKLMLKFKRDNSKKPPICAYKGFKKNDPIMNMLLKSGLDNKKDDRVKIIFYPAPISIADGLLSMEYYELLEGMHLGIFPSIYEPWGYTPLETAAHGVMSVTTDIAGFGKFILKNSDQRGVQGITILRTEDKKRDEVVDELVNIMYSIAKLRRKERIEKKLEAYKLASLANWKNFAQYYIEAHNLAIERCKKRL